MNKLKIANLKPLLYPTCIAISIILPIFIAGFLGYRFNLSPSMPVGIWKISYINEYLNVGSALQLSDEAELHRGSVAAFCLPIVTPIGKLMKDRKILPTGICPGNTAPLLKTIAASAGDTIILTEKAVIVNDHKLKNSITYKQDSIGLFLPYYKRGKYLVEKDEVWLISEYHSHSLDSRYFGAIKKENIIAIMQPVWIWR